MPRQATTLTDTKIKALKPKAERYRVSDFGGLLLEVMPTGSKIWRYRYQLNGALQPALTIGAYPAISLAEARTRRDMWAAMVARGESPKRAVQVAKAALGIRLRHLVSSGLRSRSQASQRTMSPSCAAS
jgi:hypothetical protein